MKKNSQTESPDYLIESAVRLLYPILLESCSEEETTNESKTEQTDIKEKK